jgi:hypothetical protein
MWKPGIALFKSRLWRLSFRLDIPELGFQNVCNPSLAGTCTPTHPRDPIEMDSVSPEDQKSSVSPCVPNVEGQEIYGEIGCILMMIQMVEEKINRAFLVIATDEIVTMEQLEQMDASRRTGSLRRVFV